MAVIDELDILDVPPERRYDVKRVLAEFFWNWYHQHQDDVVLKKRVFGLFSIELRVKDIRAIFVALFGPQPVAVL